MDTNLKEIPKQDSCNSLDSFYKFSNSSNDLPKLTISESSNSTRYDSYRKKIPKRVSFNKNVTVVNIQSHKKYLRKQNHQTFSSGFEEDFNDENNKNCVNCTIF